MHAWYEIIYLNEQQSRDSFHFSGVMSILIVGLDRKNIFKNEQPRRLLPKNLRQILVIKLLFNVRNVFEKFVLMEVLMATLEWQNCN